MAISVACKLHKIGEVAAISGLPVKTIRYYEEIGLLTPTVERSDSGYRLFEEAVLSRLAFIKRVQSLGLSLSEIKDILEVRDRGQLPCAEVKQQLESKVEAIEQQIQALETLKTELSDILERWQERPSAERSRGKICPNIEFEG